MLCAGVDTWLKLHARLIAVILGLNRISNSCKKNSIPGTNCTKKTSWQMEFHDQIVTFVSSMILLINDGIKLEM